MAEKEIDFNTALHFVYFQMLQENNLTAATELMKKFELDLDQKVIDELVLLHMAQHPVTFQSDVQIFRDVLELFDDGTSYNLQLLFSSIFKLFMDRNVAPKILVDFVEQTETASLVDADRRLYRDYLIKNRHISKEADPDLFELLEHIARRSVEDAIELGTQNFILDISSSPQRTRYAVQALVNAVLDHGNVAMIDEVINRVYSDLPNFQFAWSSHVKISNRLRRLEKLDLLQKHLMRASLPPQQHRLHKPFILEIGRFLELRTGENPSEHLAALYELDAAITESKNGIPKSFQPEILDRILIGEYLKHNRSLPKILYTMENQMALHNRPYKVDVFCEYILEDEGTDIKK